MNKVVWANNAKRDLNEIVSYWNKKNQSEKYNRKLKFHIEIAINLIRKNKELGIKTNLENVRMRLILNNYYLIYHIEKSEIRILRFWDVRQNPMKIEYR